MRQDLLQNSAPAATSPANETLASAAAAAGAGIPSQTQKRDDVSPARPSGFQERTDLTPNTTLYVGNLYFEVTEDALQQRFKEFGNILKTRIVYDHRGLSKGSVSRYI